VVNVPDWERVGDAAKRVILTGITEDEAQLALCRAISNRLIRVRIYLGKFESGDFFLAPTIGVEAGLIIPPHLAPRDFDWAQSSPQRSWRDAAEITAIFPDWRQDRIEVFSADVTKALCGGTPAAGAQGIQAVQKRERTKRRPAKRKQKFARQMQAPAPASVPGEQQWAPAWDPLSEALARFMSAGFSGIEAKSLICRAIIDGKIRYRWRAFTDDQVLSKLPPAIAAQIRQGLRDNPEAWRGQMEQLYPRQFMGETLHFKWPLKPEDLDWNGSRLNVSSIAEQQPGNIWIELLSAEVTDTLANDKWLQEQRARLKDSDDRQKKQQTEKWREERIQRFTNTQRNLRDWINFAEIADWCSELAGSIVSDEDARGSAYEKLQADLMLGDFEERGKSRVLYLHPLTRMARMTRDRARDFMELAPPETLKSEYWDHCWIPRHLFHRWLAKHNLSTSPSRFEPLTEPSVQSKTPTPKTNDRSQSTASPRTAPTLQNKKAGRGRRGPEPGTLDRFRDVDRALYRDIERIVRKDRKSVSAAALELAEAGKVKGPGTATSRAKRLATRFKRERT